MPWRRVSHCYCQEGVEVFAPNLTPADSILKDVWREGCLITTSWVWESRLLTWPSLTERARLFFFFFSQWCMARVGMVIVNKISILLVCPFLISLTQESGFSFYILFVSFGISGSWVFQYLVGDRRKDESQRITTVGCFSTVSLLLKSLPYPLPLCLLESSFICFMYRSSLTNDVVLFW